MQKERERAINTHFRVPDKQQLPDRASRAVPACCECVSSLPVQEGVIVLLARRHGYAASTGRISAAKR